MATSDNADNFLECLQPFTFDEEINVASGRSYRLPVCDKVYSMNGHSGEQLGNLRGVV